MSNQSTNEQPTNNQQQYLYFWDLPFEPDLDDVFYFDGQQGLKVEKWRIEYYLDEIIKHLEHESECYNLEVCPQGFYKVLLDIINTPDFWIYFSEEDRRRLQKEIFNPFGHNQIRHNGEEQFYPSFLILDRKREHNEFVFRRYPISPKSPKDTLLHVLSVLKERNELEGKIYARKIEQKLDADPGRVQNILNNIRQEISTLRSLGVDEQTISEVLVSKDQPYEIHILGNGRFLAIPQNEPLGTENPTKELRMSPLEKSVYLLFLNHPEGINFSYLPDHRVELMNYYRQLMNYRTTQQMEKSIDDVTDPTRNSINEKCARIRRIFIDTIGEAYANQYCITGTHGKPKGIHLNRSLIHSQIALPSIKNQRIR